MSVMTATPRPLVPVALVVAAIAACGQRSAGPSGPEAPSAIGAPADAIFADDFESGSLAAWQDGVNPSRQRIVTDPKTAQSGSRYLAVTYPAGQDGGWLTRFLLPGYDSLYVSLYVRFRANWQGATKLVALYGSRADDQWSAFGKSGVCPNGGDFFAAMLVTESGNPGPLRFYTYYPGMAREPDGVTCFGRFGDGTGSEHGAVLANYAGLATLSRDAWHHLEFGVQLNAPGRADGSQMLWVDGAPRASWTALSFRSSDILRLDAVQLSFSAAGGAPQTQELDVDNVVVRTSPP
jgi:polysaccharide lyase-like protein